MFYIFIFESLKISTHLQSAISLNSLSQTYKLRVQKALVLV